MWFQIFIPNINNHMVSSNYFYLIIFICLYKVIWFRVTDDKNTYEKIITSSNDYQ